MSQQFLYPYLFQSTLPVRGATFHPQVAALRRGISIHAPRAGSDVMPGDWRMDGKISIHAPRAGSDESEPYYSDAVIDFNPRSPCGERPVQKNGF